MDVIDKELLNIIQTGFPIDERPYLKLGKQVGITEELAYQKILALRGDGIIRRLGGVFDSRRLGYRSTLCAAKVPEDKIPLLASLLDNMQGVTHNYLRNHQYNMWFTLIAPTTERVNKTITDLRARSGVEQIYSLPAIRVFKIKVDLDFSGHSPNKSTTSPSSAAPFAEEHYPTTEEDRVLIRVLQSDLPLGLNPFAEIAHQINWSTAKVINTARDLVHNGVIRRFGAVLRHQKAGYIANVMGVWKVKPELVEEVGHMMAEFKEVSHCYQRPTLEDWPYNLFTMVHGRSEEECEQIIKSISDRTGVREYSMLYSLEELKKSSMKYFSENENSV